MMRRVDSGISNREPGKVKAGTDEICRIWPRNFTVERLKSNWFLNRDGIASVNSAG